MGANIACAQDFILIFKAAETANYLLHVYPLYYVMCIAKQL